MDFEDFTGRSFRNTKVPRRITGSCFSQETPVKIFPDDMNGVTFERCNLDNVILPPGNNMIDCSNRMFKAQNDLEDWELENEKPKRPMNARKFQKYNLSTEPKDIPKKKLDEPITKRKKREINGTLG